METDMTREEAIKELRCFIGQLTEGCQEAIKVLIPELAESEDERIRKIITDSVFYQCGAGVEYKDVLDYLDKLEKQKEQKPVEWDELLAEFRNINEAFGKKEVVDNPERYGLSRPAEWSEEDEKMRLDCIDIIEHFPIPSGTVYGPWGDCINWLKSLKNRGNFLKRNSNSPSWSEEDEIKMNTLLDYLDPDAGGTKYSSYAQLTEWYNWIKSLRPQPKQRWTDEDDRICHLIMANLSESTRHAITLPMDTVNMFNNWLRTLQCMPPLFTDWTDEDETLLSDALACVTMVQEIKKRGELKNFHISCTGEELRSWIRSLKSRPRKQPSWKPSEEQMKQLKSAASLDEFGPFVTTRKQFPDLESLYEQLKKLI